MKNRLEKLIKIALDSLYAENPNLIKTVDDHSINIHNHERSIVFRFGHYLSNLINADAELKLYQIDVEYNRNIYDIKRLIVDENLRNVYPDLVIHKRETSDNLLVIEFKTWWNPNQCFDVKKIKAFMKHSGGYEYKYGLLIKINKESGELKWIEL